MSVTAWQPQPGETQLARDLVAFATGVAPQVSGMRWFRDTNRLDVQDHLPGWPEGPRYAPRTKPEQRTRSAARFGLRGLYAVVAGGLETLAGSGSVTKVPRAIGHPPEDPDNEVEDFPVLWAAPDSLARTLPWQLDPGRRPAGYLTYAVVTDRRVVILGRADDGRAGPEVLWECARTDIAGAERRNFSKENSDAVIRFTDGSWCRLHVSLPYGLLRYLATPHELLGDDRLSPGQREAVAAFTARHALATRPVVSRRPSGNVLVEYRTGDGPPPAPGSGTGGYQLMGPDGEDVEDQPDDY
ncbi:hypothetical protein ACFQ0X_19465 [Streptomyces rectiviolaceus]|uniref:Uncharacterized protein n=1 Tax=Streptomyces rectiviolaceus TaxID=332591 RepID=A0ABP6M9S3_9ACTN